MASDAHNIASLLEEVNVNGNGLLNDSQNENAKKALLESARKLVASLESPFEVIARMNWQQPFIWAATRIGLDINLFKAMVSEDACPKSSEKLGTMTGCDPILLSRFLKHLNAAGFVKETGPDEYEANPISTLLATRIPAGMTKNCYDYANFTNARLPQFLKNTGYQNPTNKDATAFKFGVGTDLHYFDWLSQPGNEEKLDDMKAHMDFKTLGKKWFQCVDVEQLFDNPTDPDAVLMIDIGGSAGHDIIDFHKAFPEMPGKLILQELPAVVQSLAPDFPLNIQAQAYDCFDPQPVQHAKVYYLHHVLHDWPDESCRKMLSNIKMAMKKGYSKILLNEIVIPAVNADWFETSVDMLMLTCHSAQERTEGAWKELLGSVGLKITKIWDCEGSSEKVIEVEVE